MNWQTPKIDWAPADGVRDTDMNRIEGNILNLYNTSYAHNDINIYVSSTGNDDTGDGTIAAPYATITKGLSVLPQSTGGKRVSLIISEGTYNEDVVISSFAGLLTLSIDGTITIGSLTIQACTVNITGTASRVITTNVANGIIVSDGGNLIGYGSITVNGNNSQLSCGVDIGFCSNFSLYGTLTINSMNTALRSKGSSHTYIETIAGSGSFTGIASIDGSITAYTYSNLSVVGALAYTAGGGSVHTGNQV